MDTFVQYTSLRDDVGRITGHKQPFNHGVAGLHQVGQLFAVHLWHDHIGEKQVNSRVMRIGQRNGLFW